MGWCFSREDEPLYDTRAFSSSKQPSALKAAFHDEFKPIEVKISSRKSESRNTHSQPVNKNSTSDFTSSRKAEEQTPAQSVRLHESESRLVASSNSDEGSNLLMKVEEPHEQTSDIAEDDTLMDRADNYRTLMPEITDERSLMAVAFDKTICHVNTMRSTDDSNDQESVLSEPKPTEIAQAKYESVNAQNGKKANRSKSRKKKGKK
uniref:AlNc14C87G5571 protein n=1 Tax=Albugo laibachii Nc14 TaxID=890382 RepID=F0WG41_9STRA|nr:AlNc14C87G5571 [Albugo laibachii Nc14]|eukprot:CCA20176.1 AlNc14C87G5571 [Albugo laibachii Nc14]